MTDLLGHHKCGSHMSVKSYTLSSSPASTGIRNCPIFACALFSCIHRTVCSRPVSSYAAPPPISPFAQSPLAATSHLQSNTAPPGCLCVRCPVVLSLPILAVSTDQPWSWFHPLWLWVRLSSADARERYDVNAVRVERELVRLIFWNELAPNPSEYSMVGTRSIHWFLNQTPIGTDRNNQTNYNSRSSTSLTTTIRAHQVAVRLRSD